MKLSTLFIGIIMLSPLLSLGQSTKQSLNIDYMPVKINGSNLWSIIDAKGNVIYEDEFPGDVSSAVNGYFIYRNGNRKSLYKVDKRPELVGDLVDVKAIGFPSEGLIPVVPNELDRIEYRHLDGTPAFTLKPVNGKEIRSVNNIFTDGLAIFMTDDWYFGAINPKGDIVITPDKYTWIHPFNENLAVAELDNGLNRRDRSIERERSYVVIDTKGNIVFKLKPDETPQGFFKDGKLVINRKGGGSGYYNRFGEFHRFPPKVSEVDFIKDNYVVYRSQPSEPYQSRPNNCGVIDLEGNNIIKPQYQYIVSIDGNHFLAMKANEKKTYFIDNNNNVIKILPGWITPIPAQNHNRPSMLTSDFSYMSEYPHNYLDSNFKPLVPGDLGHDGIEDDNVNPAPSIISSDYFNPEKTGADLATRISTYGLDGIDLGASADKIPTVANGTAGKIAGITRFIATNITRGYPIINDIYYLNKGFCETCHADQAKIKYISTITYLDTPTKRKYISGIKKGALNSLLNRGFQIKEKQKFYTVLNANNGNIAFLAISGDCFSISLLPSSVWDNEEKTLKNNAVEAYNKLFEE